MLNKTLKLKVLTEIVFNILQNVNTAATPFIPFALYTEPSQIVKPNN